MTGATVNYFTEYIRTGASEILKARNVYEQKVAGCATGRSGSLSDTHGAEEAICMR